MKKPLLFIISGPSGAGKTTILDRLIRKKFFKENFILAVSCTTRCPRPGEKEGRDYFFLDQKTFLKRRKKGFFLETQKVAGNYYGTPGFFLETAAEESKDIIICIDVKGALQVQKTVSEESLISVFISAPDEQELLNRLKKRKEKKEVIAERIKLAKKELQYLKYYGYLVINENLEESIKNLEIILKAERMRRR